MRTVHSAQHREIVGSVNDAPYTVSFDADGFAEVDDAVAEQLTSADYGVSLIDEDGAVVNADKEAEAKRIADEEAAEQKRLAEEAKKAAKEAKKGGSDPA